MASPHVCRMCNRHTTNQILKVMGEDLQIKEVEIFPVGWSVITFNQLTPIRNATLCNICTTVIVDTVFY